MKRTKDYITPSILIIAFLALLGIAGATDAKDATIAEMQNNGAYYSLRAEHPNASENELIRIYNEQLHPE